jgi:hypothetical protein
MTFRNPQYLVETDWFGQHLGDPELRIIIAGPAKGTTLKLNNRRPAGTGLLRIYSAPGSREEVISYQPTNLPSTWTGPR